jgi:5-methylcytosine-specific restriction endonuclease McrA
MNHDIYHPRYVPRAPFRESEHLLVHGKPFKKLPLKLPPPEFKPASQYTEHQKRLCAKAGISDLILPKVNSNRHRRRKTIFAETGNHCVYCNEVPDEAVWTIDHVWPKAKGGNENKMNLVPACSPCNSKRGTKVPASDYVHPAWRDYVLKKERASGLPAAFQKPEPATIPAGERTE